MVGLVSVSNFLLNYSINIIFLSGSLLSKPHQLFKSAEQYIYSSPTQALKCMQDVSQDFSLTMIATRDAARSQGQRK